MSDWATWFIVLCVFVIWRLSFSSLPVVLWLLPPHTFDVCLKHVLFYYSRCPSTLCMRWLMSVVSLKVSIGYCSCIYIELTSPDEVSNHLTMGSALFQNPSLVINSVAIRCCWLLGLVMCSHGGHSVHLLHCLCGGVR